MGLPAVRRENVGRPCWGKGLFSNMALDAQLWAAIDHVALEGLEGLPLGRMWEVPGVEGPTANVLWSLARASPAVQFFRPARPDEAPGARRSPAQPAATSPAAPTYVPVARAVVPAQPQEDDGSDGEDGEEV